jgi:hypothetical protein
MRSPAEAPADATTAFNTLSGLTPTGDLTGGILGDGGTVLSLTPGVYCFSSSAAARPDVTSGEATDPKIRIVQFPRASATGARAAGNYAQSDTPALLKAVPVLAPPTYEITN